ncbi:MAG: hypothetical protein ACM3VU_00505 [Arthrospira platensis]
MRLVPFIRRSSRSFQEEEGEEWGEEGAAFGPSPGSKSAAHAPQATQAEEGGVYFQKLEEGQEISAPTQPKTVPLCRQAHEDHPCGLHVCMLDGRKIHPTFYNHGKYDYWEICGGGRHKGYLRVKEGTRRDRVRIRSRGGSWRTVFNTYCGIVGAAALTPGVDVFGAPAEIGCAGYGLYSATEAIIEAL